MTGDLKPEGRIWYFINTTNHRTKQNEMKYTISRYPLKVEWLKMEFLPAVSNVVFG